MARRRSGKARRAKAAAAAATPSLSGRPLRRPVDTAPRGLSGAWRRLLRRNLRLGELLCGGAVFAVAGLLVLPLSAPPGTLAPSLGQRFGGVLYTLLCWAAAPFWAGLAYRLLMAGVGRGTGLFAQPLVARPRALAVCLVPVSVLVIVMGLGFDLATTRVQQAVAGMGVPLAVGLAIAGMVFLLRRLFDTTGH